MPVFASPLLLYGLIVAVPALLAIYWLRQRARERQVSSLLLWRAEREVWDGGRRWERLQLSVLFWLELLVLLAIFGAAARPLLRAGESSRPLVVVLDDSFSMLADQGTSARERAIQAITRELRNQLYAPIRFVLAGERPQLLGETSGNLDEAARLLRQWHCGAATARLDEAIAFAFALGGKRARVLAVTDHAPAEPVNESRLQWWAFGNAQPNLAFINATRSARGDTELILLEIANLSTQRQTTTLTIENGASQSIELAAGESTRLTFKRPPSPAPLRARLGDDALGVDNEVNLLPENARRVQVALRVADAELRALVGRALQAAPNAVLTDTQPDLVITDNDNTAQEGWTVQLIKESSATSFLGPFVLDRAHPLTEGLAFGGVVWAAGAATQLPGRPIIMAGNVALLADLERAGGRHELRLRLQPGLSTLQLSPNWPVLWWNLLNWRASIAPGLRQHNLRLGEETELLTATAALTVTVTNPKQRQTQLPVTEGRVRIQADTSGLYQISEGTAQHQLAVNALHKAESDLTNGASGHWGNWANATAFEWEYRNFAWALLLLALLLLAAHAWLTFKQNRRLTADH
jgi:hypothetical protein